MNKLQDKIRGNFLGIAIGDALGKPVESLKAEVIAEKHGRIETYQNCSSHKYFQDDDGGTTTDDWQLTKSVARAFIDTGEFDLDAIAEDHKKEFAISVRGWGGTTREAIGRLVEGTPWKDSGRTEKANRGTGNGVCMKVSPVGLYMALVNPKCDDPPWGEHIANIVHLSNMTHRSYLGVTSGLAHAFATFKCFTSTPETFDKLSFLRMLRGACELGRQFHPGTLTDDFQTRFDKLNQDFTPQQIIDEFGGGTCYVYDSLPFTYAFFLRDPNSIESLYDVVNAGADTDTNGSMLAGMLGALHGTNIFPKHLIDGLKNKDEVFDVADQFYEAFAT